MTRTKIRQEIQISNSELYNDAYAAAHTAGGAEPAFNEANIEHDLNVLRTNMKDMKGTADWFGSTTHSIEAIDGYVTALETFVGSAYGETAPNYSSAVVVVQGSSLETAIGAIDAYIGALDPVVTLQDVYNNDADGGNAVITTTATDGSVEIAGTEKLLVTAAGGLEVDFATKLDGALQYTVTPTDGYFLKTDASGNASWTQVTDTDVDLNATLNVTGTGTTVETALEAHDAYMISLAASTASLDVTAGAGMTESGSLQAGTLTFDVVGTAGQITALADSIKIADAFNKTDFTSFNISSASDMTLDAQGNNIVLKTEGYGSLGVSEGYMIVNATGDGSGDTKWVAKDSFLDVVTLQYAYDNNSGAEPDILLESGYPFSIVASDGEPTLTVSDAYVRIWDASDGSPSFEVTESKVTILGGAASGDPIVEVTADYFKVFTTGTPDGPTLMVNTTSGDGYVWIDGYLAITGDTVQVNTVVTDADHWLLTPASPTQPALIIAPESSGFDGYYIGVQDAVGDGYRFFVEQDAATTRVGIIGPNASLQYQDGTEGAGKYLKSDASGNAQWAQLTASDVDVVDNYDISNSTDLQTVLEDFDAYMVGLANINVVGTTGQVDVAASGTISGNNRTFTVDLAETFSKTDFTSFQATSSGGINLDATSSSISLDSAAASNFTVAGANLTLATTTSGSIVLEDSAGTYLNTTADAYVWTVATTGTGQGKWSKLNAGNLSINDTFSSTPSSGLQLLTTVLGEMDAYIVDAYMQIDTTQGSLGSAVSGSGAWVGFTGTNILNTALTFTDAFTLLDDGYASLQTEIATLDAYAGAGLTKTGSLQAGTLTFDVVGTAGEITANANDIQIANAFSKTNFTSFAASVTGGNMALGSTDGYLYLEDLHLNADGYTAGVALSTNLLMPAGGWTASIIAVAGGTSISDIGIIDAINAAASLGGGKVEKAVYVIGASDGRLFNTGALTGNGLDLDASPGANRGSVDLASVGLGFKAERDVEVFVNGVLQLADHAQGLANGSASDDYYVASDDLTRIVFSFELVQGDVITVVNRKADSVEDVDTGWIY
jgi:hypothetical protein